MYIHEAVATARSGNPNFPYIRRKGWPYNAMKRTGSKIRITNAPGGCIAYSMDIPPEKWTPTADDLAADDWETCL